MLRTVIATTILSNALSPIAKNPYDTMVDTYQTNTLYSITQEEEYRNPIFDDFIDNRETVGNDKIRNTFTDDFIQHLVSECEENEVDPWLVIAIMEAESSFDPNAKAYDGSKHYGLMQLSVRYFTDDLALEGTDDFFDAKANTSVGIKLIKELTDKTRDYKCIRKSEHVKPLETLVVLSYHRGLGNALPLFQEGETDDYTEKVITNWMLYKEIYGTENL